LIDYVQEGAKNPLFEFLFINDPENIACKWGKSCDYE